VKLAKPISYHPVTLITSRAGCRGEGKTQKHAMTSLCKLLELLPFVGGASFPHGGLPSPFPMGLPSPFPVGFLTKSPISTCTSSPLTYVPASLLFFSPHPDVCTRHANKRTRPTAGLCATATPLLSPLSFLLPLYFLPLRHANASERHSTRDGNTTTRASTQLSVRRRVRNVSQVRFLLSFALPSPVPKAFERRVNAGKRANNAKSTCHDDPISEPLSCQGKGMQTPCERATTGSLNRWTRERKRDALPLLAHPWSCLMHRTTKWARERGKTCNDGALCDDNPISLPPLTTTTHPREEDDAHSSTVV